MEQQPGIILKEATIKETLKRFCVGFGVTVALIVGIVAIGAAIVSLTVVVGNLLADAFGVGPAVLIAVIFIVGLIGGFTYAMSDESDPDFF